MKMKILFQGDSITDAGRSRENPHILGGGYANIAAKLISAKYPDISFEFINLGISGNKVEDLLARWEKDAIEIQPDIISILIGINDTWHRAAAKYWIKNDIFEWYYRMILARLKEKTKAKIIILEQFLLAVPDKEFFRIDLDPKIQIVRKLAREFADAYIPFDGLFAAASVVRAPTFWADDGVHPSAAGAKFMAEHYLNAVSPVIEATK